jgi:ElaB/YqjD/DUF883 family membrane-anchored ribosome-binding protein
MKKYKEYPKCFEELFFLQNEETKSLEKIIQKESERSNQYLSSIDSKLNNILQALRTRMIRNLKKSPV